MNETIEFVLIIACGGFVMFVGVIFGFVLGIRFNDEAKYYELIFAVGTKLPDETRHETALRYIFEAEQGSNKAKQQDLLDAFNYVCEDNLEDVLAETKDKS